MNALAHLFELDRRIRAGEFPSATSLASDLDISERAVFRDRKKLVEMGADIGWSKARGGWYYRDLSFILLTARLSEGELLAFFLSVEIARSSGNTGFEETLQSAVSKIALSVGEVVSVDLNALRDSTTYSFSPAARAGVSRVCGDEPRIKVSENVESKVFPACAGMNRRRGAAEVVFQFPGWVRATTGRFGPGGKAQSGKAPRTAALVDMSGFRSRDEVVGLDFHHPRRLKQSVRTGI